MKSLPLNLLLATFLFPIPILIVVPIYLVVNYGLEIPASDYWGFWVAKPLIPLGFAIAGYCVTLFYIKGEGTPAPWLPPVKLMVTGPYRYMRNPMTTGVLLILTGQGLLFSAPAFAVWFGILFVLYSAFYIFVEEPGLKKRFGDDYVLYKANVGRWIPRFSAWDAPWLPKDDEDEDEVEAEGDNQPETKDDDTKDGDTKDGDTKE